MMAELGVFLLVFALMLSLFQTTYLWPVYTWRKLMIPCLPVASWLQALCVAMAFCILVALRLNSDFSVANVVQHSNISMPTLYKITGAWGNHEGSLLLWALVLAMLGAVLSSSMRAGQETDLRSLATSILSTVFAGFMLFMLSTSNPFARQFPPTVDGQALNPLLQDIGLAIHPPLLYSGYVGFSVVFALAVAALIQGRMGRNWALAAHPWIMFSWTSLTLGIGLGSWWAYRELGWGGWWFWDPVENCSLLPWLCGTALMHSNIVLKRRGLLRQWVLLLAILTFGMSLLGTFLVRSGMLTSVHSFAADPTRGLFILAYMVIVIGGALFLFALRAWRIESEGSMKPLSRDGLIILNNLFLLCACATVLLGTLYPMLSEWLAENPVTVGAPYFNRTFLPIMAVPLVLAGIAPFLPWNNAGIKQVKKALLPCGLAALAAAFLVLAYAKSEYALGITGFGLSAWLLAGSIKWVWGLEAMRSYFAVFTAHVGAAVFVAGLTGASLWKQEAQDLLQTGESMRLADLTLTYQQKSQIQKENYRAYSAQFVVTDDNGKTVAMLYPEYRVYDIRNTTTSEAALALVRLGDLYLVTGPSESGSEKTPVRVYYTPLIRLVWAGFLLMALGGAMTTIIRTRRA